MNIYFVLSEELKEPDSYDMMEPGEYYKIHCFVSAEKSSQAKYLTWKSDKNSFSYDMRDIPKMKTYLVEKDTLISKGLIKENSEEEVRLYKKFDEIYMWVDPLDREIEYENFENWEE